jgi:hypothetical protein
MTDQFQLDSRFSPARTPTLRDVATIVFRHQKLLVTSFLAILSAGVLYAVLSPSSLLLSDSRLRAAASSRAQQRARQNYQWDKVVGDLGEIYAAMVRPDRNQPMIVHRRAA